MPKIIRIKNDVISVGMDNGSFFDISKKDVDFKPVVGDEVNVYKSGDKVIISKTVQVKNAVYVESQDGFRYQGRVVNQIAYGLLAILIGDFGIHKFYAGKIIQGIIFLLFFWTFIPGLIGLIEGIYAFTRKADVDGNIPA